MYNQAMALGEFDQALLMRLRELTPKERTTEEERRDFFMNGVMPKAWGEVQLEYVDTVVPADIERHLDRPISMSRYAPPLVVEDLLDMALTRGYVKTHQGLQHPVHGQLDLSVPADPAPYVKHARAALSTQGVPTQRVFDLGGQHFLLWEMLRAPDMPGDAPLVTEVVLLLPRCLGELSAKETPARRLPPTVETFAYHQIFVMIERLYAEWSNSEDLLQEIAMNVLTLRELEAIGLPRAFHLAHGMGEA